MKTECEECGYPTVYAKGLCRNCYARKLRKGSPKRKERKTEPSEKQQKILDLYTETKSAIKTANIIGCSRAYVYAVLHEYKKYTNSDRLREMSNEELAEFIDVLAPHSEWSLSLNGGTWLDWLKQEVEDD